MWSALEYAAHVRDVLDWYEGWVRQIQAEDRPVREGIDRDEADKLKAELEEAGATVEVK